MRRSASQTGLAEAVGEVNEANTLLIGGCETRGLAQLSLPKSLKPSFGLAFAILAPFTIIRLIGLYCSKVELFYDDGSHGLFYWL